MKQEHNYIIALLLSICFLSLVLFSSQVRFTGESIIDGWAVQDTVTVSVSIVLIEKNITVPASGNITFNASISPIIRSVDGLPENASLNITLYGKGLPPSWSTSEPNSSEVGTAKIEYFELNVNQSTSGGYYLIYFNLTPAELGSLDAQEISLFVFNETAENWQNLSTVVVNGVSDPVQFYGITTHFSRFLIAEKPSLESEEDEDNDDQEGSSSGGSGGGGSSSGKKKVQPAEEAEEVTVVTKEILKPIHKAGSLLDVSLEIPEKYRKLLAGETLIGEINLINIKEIGLISVQLEYQLQDAAGNLLSHSFETKVVENRVTYLKELELPEDLPPGDYMFFIQVNYGEDLALAGYPFEVVSESDEGSLVGLAGLVTKASIPLFGIPLFLIVIVFLLIVIFTLYFFQHKKGNSEKSNKQSELQRPLQRLKSLYK